MRDIVLARRLFYPSDNSRSSIFFFRIPEPEREELDNDFNRAWSLGLLVYGLMDLLKARCGPPGFTERQRARHFSCGRSPFESSDAPLALFRSRHFAGASPCFSMQRSAWHVLGAGQIQIQMGRGFGKFTVQL